MDGNDKGKRNISGTIAALLFLLLVIGFLVFTVVEMGFRTPQRPPSKQNAKVHSVFFESLA